MNATLPAVLLVLLLSGTWLLGRRRSRPFLRSTDTSDVVALNRAQIERVRVPRPAEPDVALQETPPPAPAPVELSPSDGLVRPDTGRPRQARLRQLQAWLSGSRDQRLDAIATAHGLRHRSVLPLLHRALRDPDPAVMAAAAAAMERYRGRSAGTDSSLMGHQPRRVQAGRAADSRLPRNVSRTR